MNGAKSEYAAFGLIEREALKKPVRPEMRDFGVNEKSLEHYEYASKGLKDEIHQEKEERGNNFGCLVMVS